MSWQKGIPALEPSTVWQSGAPFGNCHLIISLFNTFHTSPHGYHQNHYTKLPRPQAPLIWSHVGFVFPPMTWQLPRGLDHPDTLTFEHNLAAPWTWRTVGTPNKTTGSSNVTTWKRPKKSGIRKWWHFAKVFQAFGVLAVFFLDLWCGIWCPKLGV